MLPDPTPNLPQLKQCHRCKEWKPATIEYFYWYSKPRELLRHECRMCKRELMKARYQEKREQIIRHVAEWKRANPQKMYDYGRKYREKYTEEIRQRRRGCIYPQPFIPDGHKPCTKCGQIMPATSEHFYVNSRKSDGLQSWCQKCRKQHHQENIENIKEYRRLHAVEHSEVRRRYYAKNQERLLAAYRHYRAVNKDAINERNRLWRIANIEKARERDRRYAAENKDKIAAKNLRRRALMVGAEGSHTADDVKRQYKAQKGKCYWCGVKVGKTYDVDHIVPLVRGGSNWPENLVVSCPTCNASKGAKLPHEWSKSNRLL